MQPDERGLPSARLTDIVVAAMTEINGFTLLPAVSTVVVTGNEALDVLDGFDNVLAADSITIADNAQLTWLVGFVNLPTITGPLVVANNPDLGSLSGFELLDSTGDLTLTGANGQRIPVSQIGKLELREH